MSSLTRLFFVSVLFTGCWCNCQNGWLVFNDACYLVGFEQSLTFVEAEHYCRQHNGHLIHVNSAGENRFIVDYLHKTRASYCWIGISDMDVEGKWEWYGTGEAPEFTYWHPGEPGGGGGEDCGVYKAAHPDYRWDDYPCDSQFHPICEASADDGGSIVG